MSGAIFERDGALFVPTALARGPWDPRALHGGAPAALLARTLETLLPESDLVRLGVEFVRPVPLAPLELHATLESAGRQVQRSGAVLLADGREVARARGLHLRRRPLSESPDAAAGVRPGESGRGVVPAASGPVPDVPGAVYDAFHNRGMEVRFGYGSFTVCGPALAWFRLRVPLLAGEPTPAVARAAAACDFGNGVSAVLPWETHVFVNADLTLHLARAPSGEWIGIEAVTRAGPNGSALAECVVRDDRGPIGTSAQHLLLELRPDETGR